MGKTPVQVTKDLKLFKERVTRKIKVSKLLLFGSMARGTNRKDSDVDVILVSPNFKKQRWIKRAPPLYKFWPYNRPFELLCYTPAEFRKMEKLSIVVREAIREGIEI
ncbi:nucleotidyltransferase domain-containing protein [Candidatus Woesearchaeota archaeon]|nr:nucleotidyltransferase domain-containing protein [Candidatus Woesearchaeota archaeon]